MNLPEWRNGRRKRLKIVRGQPHESSSLSSGTEQANLFACVEKSKGFSLLQNGAENHLAM